MKMADRELVEVSAVRLSIIVDMGIRQWILTSADLWVWDEKDRDRSG
jgi:hypothetical protein